MLIAHISDLHVLESPDPSNGSLAGNAARLHETIASICALQRAPDIAVITGDISHEGTEDDYAFCRSLLEKLPCPFLVIPGNHDDRKIMRQVFPIAGADADPDFYQFDCNAFPLRIIGIDTLEPGQVGGSIRPEKLDWIREALLHSEKPVLILMHHPPYPFGHADNPDMQCTDGSDALAEMIRKNARVAAILCGHLHLMTSSIFADVTALSAPSVAPAFKLDIGDSKLTGWCPSSPAFALHFLDRNAALTTHIIRVDECKFVTPL